MGKQSDTMNREDGSITNDVEVDCNSQKYCKTPEYTSQCLGTPPPPPQNQLRRRVIINIENLSSRSELEDLLIPDLDIIKWDIKENKQQLMPLRQLPPLDNSICSLYLLECQRHQEILDVEELSSRTKRKDVIFPEFDIVGDLKESERQLMSSLPLQNPIFGL